MRGPKRGRRKSDLCDFHVVSPGNALQPRGWDVASSRAVSLSVIRETKLALSGTELQNFDDHGTLEEIELCLQHVEALAMSGKEQYGLGTREGDTFDITEKGVDDLEREGRELVAASNSTLRTLPRNTVRDRSGSLHVLHGPAGPGWSTINPTLKVASDDRRFNAQGLTLLSNSCAEDTLMDIANLLDIWRHTYDEITLTEYNQLNRAAQFLRAIAQDPVSDLTVATREALRYRLRRELDLLNRDEIDMNHPMSFPDIFGVLLLCCTSISCNIQDILAQNFARAISRVITDEETYTDQCTNESACIHSVKKPYKQYRNALPMGLPPLLHVDFLDPKNPLEVE
ncbi:hypothetical protein FKW77_009624 [Venturia effusa]|uniref:Uncharacterized protein n=1 Tax=Venturia effusa TaxID=50376 RepID=A0A517KXD1_9PEZI|nr:hypothetical protein FKW77_009624 [Venturia effusa]